MTDKLWLLPFGPDQIHLPTLHSPDSGGFIMSDDEIARGFMACANFACSVIEMQARMTHKINMQSP